MDDYVRGRGLLRRTLCLWPAASLIALTIASPARAEDDPFVITVGGDGQVVESNSRQSAASARSVDVKVTFDGLDVQPRLNVSTDPVSTTYRAGEAVQFRTALNYPDFITRGEIIVTGIDGNGRRERVATIPAPANGLATWQIPVAGPARYAYVYRVYDASGRFD